MSAVTCMALAATVLPLEPTGPSAEGCLGVGAEVAGRLSQRFPRGGTDRGFSLTRSRFDVGLERNGTGARLVLAGTRSGGPGSYIGVAGESIVPQVQVAEARYRAATAGLVVAAGLVDDLWVASDNTTWDLRVTDPGIGEAAGWFSRSDLGATIGWTTRGRWVTGAASLTSGEGLERRERNNGQDAATLIVVRPLAGSSSGPDSLALHLYAREGSYGLGYVRDHRAGARVTHRSPWAAAGVGWLRAWGVEGDGGRRPQALSTWFQLTPLELPALAWARLDRLSERSGKPDDQQHRIAAGVGLPLPRQPGPGSPMRVLIGWQRTDRDIAVTSLAGAAATTRSDSVYAQLDFRVREAVSGTTLLDTP